MRFITDGLLKHLHPRGDDDFVDRLNYYFTPALFLLAAALVSGKQYVAKPIQCWVPPQFTRSMEEYIESYCWIQNTYWLPAHEHIPDDQEARESRQIGYYQWVPFILLLEGFLFTLPCIWWRTTNRRSGLDLNQLVTALRDVQLISERLDKSRIYTCTAQCLVDVLDLQIGLIGVKGKFPLYNRNAALRRSCFSWPCYFIRWRRSGYYVTAFYLLTKLLYAANAVGQFFLLNSFLKNDSYQFYGYRVLIDLFSGREWRRSGHFPRVTLCDFEVRTVGNLNRYTVQCALGVNIFNEKIFVFVWVWLCLVAFITTVSFVCWFFNMAFRTERMEFISEYLGMAAITTRHRNQYYFADSAATYARFVDQYLRIDGVMALRMIAIHAGDLACVEIVKRLWKEYTDRYEFDADQYRCHQNTDAGTSSADGQCRQLLITTTKETLLSDFSDAGRLNESPCN